MIGQYGDYLSGELDTLKAEGLYKSERIITTPQQAAVQVEQSGDQKFINFCANNYLGLSN